MLFLKNVQKYQLKVFIFFNPIILNTRHIESSYILQPPKYLLLFVNRFRYLNNNIIKDRCPIPLDTTVMLGPLKFNLQATIDHHGPSIDSGHYTASINCCKTRQIWGIWKLRLAHCPETPNLGQNRWCLVPCDPEIWWMTLENNRASLLCCFKLCATFHSHRWIQTGVRVPKRPI